MNLAETKKRIEQLDIDLQRLGNDISRQEGTIDAAVQEVAKRFGSSYKINLDKPQDIPFDKIIGDTQAKIESLGQEIDKELTVIEKRTEEAYGIVDSLISQG